MVARAAELAAQPGHYATDQFNNPYIIPDHRDKLGREIWEQTDGRVTAFCHGMGTASSVMGVSEALRPRGVFIQAHEPASSAAISGGAAGAVPDPGLDRAGHAALGRREGWTTSEPIGDDEAIAMTRRLARTRGSSPASPRARTSSAHTVSRSASAPTRSSSRSRSNTGFKYTSVSPFGDT